MIITVPDELQAELAILRIIQKSVWAKYPEIPIKLEQEAKSDGALVGAYLCTYGKHWHCEIRVGGQMIEIQSRYGHRPEHCETNISITDPDSIDQTADAINGIMSFRLKSNAL